MTHATQTTQTHSVPNPSPSPNPDPGTQHDAQGNPVVNAKFPDLAGLVKYGHGLGFEMGWYENGCACGERHALMQNYEGDVRRLHELGFDGVKLDGCGAQRNMTLYAQLMKATGRAYSIENCHWGRCTRGDDSSCPTADWCPFNWFRTSGDINPSPTSWLANLQTTRPFQDAGSPLSRPGCWAYPDMLEVGRILVDGAMHYRCVHMHAHVHVHGRGRAHGYGHGHVFMDMDICSWTGRCITGGTELTLVRGAS